MLIWKYEAVTRTNICLIKKIFLHLKFNLSQTYDFMENEILLGHSGKTEKE